MKPIAEPIARISGQSFSRKYVALGRIVNQWPQIVGQDLATKAQPVKVNYRKVQKDKKKLQASLDIATSSADATILHYQKDLIIEKINNIFGEAWITAIRFVHVPANKKETKRSKPEVKPCAEEENSLRDILQNVEDQDIRNTLMNLGLSILTETKQ